MDRQPRQTGVKWACKLIILLHSKNAPTFLVRARRLEKVIDQVHRRVMNDIEVPLSRVTQLPQTKHKLGINYYCCCRSVEPYPKAEQ